MKFEDFLGAKKAEKHESEHFAIGGSFSCQSCIDDADEAEYYPVEHLLIWKCQDGHTSYLENFSL